MAVHRGPLRKREKRGGQWGQRAAGRAAFWQWRDT